MNINKAKFFKGLQYEPHKGQQEYHYSDVRFKVPVCGRRYGKSTMAARDMEPELFVPNRMFWIAGPTYDLGEKEFRVIWDDLIVKKQLGRDKRVRKGFAKKSGSMYIELPWRTRVEVRSAQHPDSLVGEGLDGIILSEAAKHTRETWERYIRPALADKLGWASFPTTPEGQNWLYDLWRLGNNPDFPDYQSWKNPAWDNHMVYPGGRQDPEILLLEKTTPEAWFKQEIGADFTSFVGKVYGEWDELTHVKKVEFNPDWPNYIAWDWGYVNPLAAIEFQVSPDDTIYIWREHYESYLRLEEHFEKMRQREQPNGYHITNTFGDAADPEAVATVNEKFAPCIALPEAKQNWRQGIDLVKRFLKEREIGEDEYGAPYYKPGLIVDHSCYNTNREFGSYRGRPSKTQDPTELGRLGGAQKKDDHAMDAIRYALMHIYVLGAVYHLSDVVEINREFVTQDRITVPAEVSNEAGIFTMKDSF